MGEQASASGLVLITRPVHEGRIYADEMARAGYASLLEPMLIYRDLDFEISNIEQYDALVCTSAQGIERLAAQTPERDTRLYVVGEGSRMRAEALGFEDVHCARGAANDLAALIAEDMPSGAACLYVRAAQVSYPLAETLAAQGFTVEEVAAYEAVQAETLSAECAKALREGRIAAVTFFSKRTAEAFVKAVEQAGLSPALARIKALCISETVLNYVQPVQWQNTYSAQTPDKDGMSACLRQHVVPTEEMK